jgi:hypothetical protein
MSQSFSTGLSSGLVGRQGNETDVWRQIGGGIALMEAGPVPGVEELAPSSGNLQK